MDTAIVVFTRDLRLHDNPALHQAYVRARQVVPLFVADPAIAAPPEPRPLPGRIPRRPARVPPRARRRPDPAPGRPGRRGDQAGRRGARDRGLHRRRRVALRHHPPPQARARMRPAPDRADPDPRADRGTARRAEAGRRRPLPGLHPVLARLARRRLARLPSSSRSTSSCPRSRRSAASPRRRPPRRGWLPAGRRPAASGSSAGGSACWPVTARTTTTWPAMRPPGCLPTCGSAACRRSRWRSARWTGPAARNTVVSSPGATSSTRSRPRSPDIARKSYRPGAA